VKLNERQVLAQRAHNCTTETKNEQSRIHLKLVYPNDWSMNYCLFFAFPVVYYSDLINKNERQGKIKTTTPDISKIFSTQMRRILALITTKLKSLIKVNQ